MSFHPKSPLVPFNGSPIFYQGADLSNGVKPSVLFFALSAHMSLFEDPFNQPVLRLSENGVRVFSWDLPFHGYGDDPHQAMRHWAHEFIHRPSFISDFLEICQHNLDYLIDQQLVDPKQLAVAGLSRGAFIATHFAAKDSRINKVLGFAPLTKPQPHEEIPLLSAEALEKVALTSLVENLTSTNLRFYIGNHDTRVGTEHCFSFIYTLTQAAFEKGIRSPPIELIIYPSIGYKGHGTPSHIFFDGADWLKKQLAL